MSPLEALAAELGAVAGRIERESGLRIAAALSDLQRRDAERDLRMERMERAIADRIGALRDGAPGERGQPGEAGERGERGEPGQAGERGAAGERGEVGQSGERGAPGERGESGERGEAGLPGERGADGAPGERGDRGPEGPQGKLPLCRAWEPGVHYEADVRGHDGALWQALRDTAQEPGGDEWICLARAGRDGATARFVGTFDVGTTYRALDVVALNAGSFVALSDGPGACPGPGWQLVAGPGRRGDRGGQGERGERGLRGEPGADAPLIVGWRVDAVRYVAVPVLSDESEGAVLDLRPLFERFLEESAR